MISGKGRGKEKACDRGLKHKNGDSLGERGRMDGHRGSGKMGLTLLRESLIHG